MAEDWYFEPELVRLREDMLLAHEAWKRAAPTTGLGGEGSEAPQYPLMVEVRKAVDAYLDSRERYSRVKGGSASGQRQGSIPESF